MSMQSRREELGWSLRELSRRSGVAFGYLSEIERGARPFDSFTVGRLRKVAAALGTTPARLIEEEDQR